MGWEAKCPTWQRKEDAPAVAAGAEQGVSFGDGKDWVAVDLMYSGAFDRSNNAAV